jgi:hypothetical protein
VVTENAKAESGKQKAEISVSLLKSETRHRNKFVTGPKGLAKKWRQKNQTESVYREIRGGAERATKPCRQLQNPGIAVRDRKGREEVT